MRVKSLVAVIALAGFASVAGAENRIWFEATSGPGVPGGGQLGGPGQVLSLGLNGSYTVEWRMDADQQMQSWGADMNAAAGSGLAVTAFTNNSVIPQALGTPTVGPAPNLITNLAGGFSLLGPFIAPGADILLATFTLTTGGVAGAEAFLTINQNEFSDTVFGYPEFSYAGGTPIAGTDGTRIPGSVIVTVPEPATLVLLSLGGLVFARRRRPSAC